MLTSVVDKLKCNENVLIKWHQVIDRKLDSSVLSEKVLNQVLSS